MEYRVGGSLAARDPTYLERQADATLYNALLKHEFCYVLTARQMGKSSLRLRVKDRLQKEGKGCCASIDMSRIGNENITPSQWYQGILFDLLRNFGLAHQIDLTTWWRKQGEISPLQKLSQFIETVLLIDIPADPIFIFIDEIDSVKGLDFPVDDFFYADSILLQSTGRKSSLYSSHLGIVRGRHADGFDFESQTHPL